MNDAHVALFNWIRKAGTTQAQLARDVGVHRYSITLYLQNRRRPRPAIAERIARVTQGAVPVAAWGHEVAA